jgi:hypothetical protein
MRRVIPASLLILLLAPQARASGINLSWSECGPAGTMMRSFACNTNEGHHDMVASFDPPPGLTAVDGAIGIIDLCLGGVPLTPWWQFINAGSCHQTALSALAYDAGVSGACTDYWQGAASSSVHYQVGYQGWDSARIVVNLTMPVQAAGPVEPGTEYHAFTVRIRNDDTAGSSGCGGCNIPACIVLNEIFLSQAGENVGIINTLNSNYIQWQSGFIPGCPFVVPVKNRTWGAVKTLYR